MFQVVHFEINSYLQLITTRLNVGYVNPLTIQIVFVIVHWRRKIEINNE